MTPKPEGERIAALEATMNAIDKKVDAGFLAINARLDAWDIKFDKYYSSLSQQYLDRSEASRVITELESKIGEIKKIAVTKSWLMGGAGMLIGLIASSLVGYFFTHI